MSEEVKIYPNEIVIGNKSFFGLDKDLVNLVENLTIDKINAELKRDKQKEVLDKIKENVNKEISLIDKDLSECELTYSEKYNFENAKSKYINILELLEEIE